MTDVVGGGGTDVVGAGTDVLVASGHADSGSVHLTIDGAVVDSRGRLVSVQAVGRDEATPEIRQVRARVPPW